jgi:hypothetical protein
MARTSKNRIVSAEPINITFKPANSRNAFFKGSNNIHPKGHIWLTHYNTGYVQLTFVLPPSGDYTFDSTNNGASAISISTESNQAINPPQGTFSAPTLSPDRLTLQITVYSMDSAKYFYVLNIQYKGGQPFPISDPIIVNR